MGSMREDHDELMQSLRDSKKEKNKTLIISSTITLVAAILSGVGVYFLSKSQQPPQSIYIVIPSEKINLDTVYKNNVIFPKDVLIKK